MLHHQQYTSPAIRSLVDHLDAAVAACDALREAQAHAANFHDVLRLELTAIAHVLQAREDMKELQFADGAVASQIGLFLTVTGCLEEASPSRAPAGRQSAATYLVGGRIAVTTLRAVATAMRDVVELCLASFEDETEESQRQPSPAVSEALLWATGPGCT